MWNCVGRDCSVGVTRGPVGLAIFLIVVIKYPRRSILQKRVFRLRVGGDMVHTEEKKAAEKAAVAPWM